MTYRDHCYDELARELDQWIKAIVAGPRVRGGVGSRNVLAGTARRKPAARARPKPKPKAKAAKSLKGKAKPRS